VIWGVLLVLAIPGLARRREPLVAALGLWVALQAALHLFFGTSLFLYSGQWTFAVVALAATGMERAPGAPRIADAAPFVLAGLQALTNGPLLLEILRVFAGR
jgi:hypothetical protein